jgi:hypothetical protein
VGIELVVLVALAEVPPWQKIAHTSQQHQRGLIIKYFHE